MNVKLTTKIAMGNDQFVSREIEIPLARIESDEPFILLAHQLRDALEMGRVEEIDRHELIRKGKEVSER